MSGKKVTVDFFGKVVEIDSGFVRVKPEDYILAFGGNVIEKIPKKRALEIAKTLEGMHEST